MKVALLQVLFVMFIYLRTVRYSDTRDTSKLDLDHIKYHSENTNGQHSETCHKDSIEKISF